MCKHDDFENQVYTNSKVQIHLINGKVIHIPHAIWVNYEMVGEIPTLIIEGYNHNRYKRVWQFILPNVEFLRTEKLEN